MRALVKGGICVFVKSVSLDVTIQRLNESGTYNRLRRRPAYVVVETVDTLSVDIGVPFHYSPLFLESVMSL